MLLGCQHLSGLGVGVYRSSIGKSLLALGTVINKLSEGSQAPGAKLC